MAGRVSTIWRSVGRLRFKATFVLTCVVLVVAGLSATLYLRMSHRLVMDQASARVRDMARTLAIAAARPIIEGDRSALLAVAQELIPDKNLRYVAFADPTGRILAGAQGNPGYFRRLLDDDGMTIPITRLDETMPVEDHTGPRLDFTFPVFASTSTQDHQPVVGYVRIGLSLADAHDRLTGLTTQVVGIAALIAFLMLPIGFALVNRLAKPLNRIGEAAQRFAAGNLDTRVELRRCDEIGDLATSFNAMADDLAHSHNKLVRLNAELEDRVLARTFQLTELNRQLRLEMAEKDDFLRTISHDMNAPLRNASGMVQMLRDRHGGELPSTATELLDRVDHNIRHELEMIEQLLELAHIRRGRDAPQRVDFDEEVRHIAARFQYELQAKGIRLEIERPLPSLWAERLRMRQLWQNLIDNAIKYTDPSRRSSAQPIIRIAWTEHADAYEFRVADSGIGIDTRDRDRVFYIFRRARNGFVAKTPGKGVGLANCKSIVQNYHGRIWVEPNADGGSVFCFTLAKSKLSPPAEMAASEDESGTLPKVECGVLS